MTEIKRRKRFNADLEMQLTYEERQRIKAFGLAHDGEYPPEWQERLAEVRLKREQQARLRVMAPQNTNIERVRAAVLAILSDSRSELVALTTEEHAKLAAEIERELLKALG